MIDTNKGRALWHELHSFGQDETDTEKQKAFFSRWFKDVDKLLTCRSCFRKLEWFLSRWPVSYGTEFRLWGLCLHDYVNKELGRNLFYPEFTVALLMRHGVIQ